MLYFLLVLGIVPGTNFQVSFEDVLALAALLLLLFIWRLRLFTSTYHQEHELSVVSRRARRRLNSYELSSVQLTGHKAVAPQERISRRPLYVRGPLIRQYERSMMPQRYLVRPETVSFA